MAFGEHEIPSTAYAIRRYLKSEAVQGDLRERLADIHENVTTSIHEAALIARMSEAQLRYAEAKRLLVPRRTLDAPVESAGHKGQRRYSLEELRRLVIIGKLLETYSPSEVAQFFDSYDPTLQDVIEIRQTPLRERVFIAEQTVFQRFLVPRLLYTALALLLENTLDGEIGVYIPVRDNADDLNEVMDRSITDSSRIDTLGRSLIGWHNHGRPFSAFLNEPPVLDTPQNFQIAPLTSLLADVEPMRGAAAPIAVHLAYEHSMEAALLVAANDARQRQAAAQRSHEGDTLAARRPIADPRAVAARLFWLAQQTPDDQSPTSLARMRDGGLDTTLGGDFSQEYMRYALRQRASGLAPYPALWRSVAASSDSMVYNAPEFTDPLLGDAQLSQLAETVVQLGGARTDKKDDWRWQFACILEPLNRNTPRYLHELVVRAQTARSPYKLGVTRAPTNPSQSISTHAYQRGVSVYRSARITGDQITTDDIADTVRSSIAMPLEGVDGEVVGVLYVAGADEDAFDQNDHLLLRIMARFVGELLVAYRTRNLSQATIAAAIASPDVIAPDDRFRNDNDFTRDLDLQFAPHVAPAESLTFLAVDITDQGYVVAAYGAQISRLLAEEVGSRISEHLRLQFNRSDLFTLYHIYADRFFVMLRDVSSLDAQNFAYHLRDALGGAYHIRGDLTIDHVNVRAAAITYTMANLLAMDAQSAQGASMTTGAERRRATVVRANITRTLDEALTLAKHSGARNIITWDPDQRRLVEWNPAPTTPLIAAGLLAQLASAPENSQEALIYKMLTNLMNKNH